MKSLFLALAIALSVGCSTEELHQQLRDQTKDVLVTGTEQVPGHTYKILGPVQIDGGTIYRDCQFPENLAALALKQYGKVDAVVGFKTGQGNCAHSGGISLCNKSCDGTAVVFDR